MALVSVQWFTMNRLFQWWCSTQKKQKGFTPAWATNQVAMNQDLPSESPKNCVDVKLCHCCSLMQNYIHSSHSSSYIFSVFDLVISSYIAFSSICWYVYIYTHQLLNVYIYIHIYRCVFGIYVHIFYSNWHCFFNSWNLPRCWFQPRRIIFERMSIDNMSRDCTNDVHISYIIVRGSYIMNYHYILL